jgi:hypothetical protein
VIDPVEELLQIHIDHHPVAVLHVALCFEHRVVRTASRSEAIAVFGERRVNLGCKTCSRACWISRSVTVGIPSSRTPAVRLRDLDAAHRRGPVAAIQ